MAGKDTANEVVPTNLRLQRRNEKSSFMVHTTVLKTRSTFFASALSGRWESSDSGVESKTISLPEDEPLVFDHYLRCVYQQDSRIRLSSIKSGNPERLHDYDPEEDAELMMLYGKTHILADKLGDCVSANVVMDSLIDDISATRLVPEPVAVNEVWKRTPESSPLRKLCIETWTNEVILGEGWKMGADEDPVPHSFLQEIFRGLAQLTKARKGYDVCDANKWFTTLYDRKASYHQYDRRCSKPAEECEEDEDA